MGNKDKIVELRNLLPKNILEYAKAEVAFSVEKVVSFSGEASFKTEELLIEAIERLINERA